MSTPDVDDLVQTAVDEKREVQRDFQQTVLSGVALTVPFFVTALVLTWTLNMLSNALTPVANILFALGLAEGMNSLLVEGIAATLIFGLIFVVGLIAQHGPNTHLGNRFDTLMEDLPGLGSIYTSVERMSDVMVEGDTDSFQEVKLVEFPNEGSYSLAFLTAETPSSIEDAAGHEQMLTVFVPMAPNPVMGGHLLSLPEDRVYDVDLSVEEGMQAIITTGIAMDGDTQPQSA